MGMDLDDESEFRRAEKKIAENVGGHRGNYFRFGKRHGYFHRPDFFNNAVSLFYSFNSPNLKVC